MACFKNNNKFIQYQLWTECNNGCKFCCNRGQPQINKVERLKYILSKIRSPEVLEYQEVGLIGGEFFDGQINSPELEDLFFKIIKTLIASHFEKIYITTSLIFEMEKYLLRFLRQIPDLRKITLCTSFDTMYRFNKKGKKEKWENNMRYLQNNFPSLDIHIETILTKHFINSVLNSQFDINTFNKEYNVIVDYIEPASGMYYANKQECGTDLPEFFPTKKEYLLFLKKVAAEKTINLDTFLSMELRANKLYYIDTNNAVQADNRRDTNGAIICIDTSKKYEIGLSDSAESMREIALLYKETLDGN